MEPYYQFSNIHMKHRFTAESRLLFERPESKEPAASTRGEAKVEKKPLDAYKILMDTRIVAYMLSEDGAIIAPLNQCKFYVEFCPANPGRHGPLLHEPFASASVCIDFPRFDEKASRSFEIDFDRHGLPQSVYKLKLTQEEIIALMQLLREKGWSENQTKPKEAKK